jgi:NAD(P)-dependent dehydrogenase (short-subunit alcohol dehydrogenase family)
MMRLAGRHALVTGGGSGIGAAIARALAAEKARVTLVGRRQEALDAIATELRSSRAKSRGARPDLSGERPSTTLGTSEVGVFAADITDPAQVAAAMQAARSANGPIDILINNAGAAESAPFHKLTLDAWRQALAVNLDALFLVTQAALPDLRAAEHGRVVTIASTAGLKGYGYTAPYVAAKHGAIGFTRALAAEFARTNLTVNAVCPGFTETEIVERSVETIKAKSGRTADEARAELARFNPQGRLIQPQEVADAVLWLCLPSSQSVTGQAIVVAGGEVT